MNEALQCLTCDTNYTLSTDNATCFISPVEPEEPNEPVEPEVPTSKNETTGTDSTSESENDGSSDTSDHLIATTYISAVSTLIVFNLIVG